MKIVQVCPGCGVATRLYENDPGCFACTDCLSEGEEYSDESFRDYLLNVGEYI